MPSLSPSQLRAARALINWSRKDLSKKAGISELTIHRYENETHNPSNQTKQKLCQFLETAGIEFMENDGVRLKAKNTETFEGIDGFNNFFDFFYRHLDLYGGDVCLNIYDETTLSRCRKDPVAHRQKMKSILEKKKASFKILTTISDFVTYGYAHFRWQPQQKPFPTGFYVFGDCLALMSFVNPKLPYIVVIHSAPIAEGYRQTFSLAWESASAPPSQTFSQRTAKKK